MREPRSDRVYVHCSQCGHTWVAAHLPMEARKFAKQMAMVECQQCGSSRDIFMATKEQAAALEQAA